MSFKQFKKNKAFGKAKKPAMFTPPQVAAPDQTDDALDVLTRQLEGDRQRAKRVLNLKAQYPAGTLPELVTMEWLLRQGIQFEYQAIYAGGRARRGGLVPDFVLQHGAGAMVWLIDGVRWHDPLFNGRGMKDKRNDVRLLGQTVSGRRVDRIVHITDQAIYARYPEVFKLALSGIQLSS